MEADLTDDEVGRYGHVDAGDVRPCLLVEDGKGRLARVPRALHRAQPGLWLTFLQLYTWVRSFSQGRSRVSVPYLQCEGKKRIVFALKIYTLFYKGIPVPNFCRSISQTFQKQHGLRMQVYTDYTPSQCMPNLISIIIK
jgi:hypothetical protein